MRKLKYLLLIITGILCSCNENEWLKEVPFDFYAPENSYTIPEQFNSAVARLYEELNAHVMYSGFAASDVYHYTSDIAYYAITTTHELVSYIDNLTPESAFTRRFWSSYYRIIYDANVIQCRLVSNIS